MMTHLFSAQMSVPTPHQRQSSPACRKMLRPALQNSPCGHTACDSHWICAKSVFENAECQKKKGRGRQHDRNRPVEKETKRAFLLYQTFCQRSRNMGGREEKMWPAHPVLYPP